MEQKLMQQAYRSSRISCLSRILVGAVLALGGMAAEARPQLVESSPADHQDVDPGVQVTLHFSQKLRLPPSDAVLFMTSMPGRPRHPQMGMAVSVALLADGRSLRIVPDQPLPRGTYRVDWKAMAADRHLTKGRVDFRVK